MGEDVITLALVSGHQRSKSTCGGRQSGKVLDSQSETIKSRQHPVLNDIARHPSPYMHEVHTVVLYFYLSYTVHYVSGFEKKG